VTGDDVIPMIDVDTEFSSTTLTTDLYWLMKVTNNITYSVILYNYYYLNTYSFVSIHYVTLTKNKRPRAFGKSCTK